MWRERVEPRGHAMLEWNRAESVIAAQRQRSTKRLELAFPREWGMGLKVRPKIVARFTISGCIVRILGGEEEAARAHYSLKRLGITVHVGIEFGLAARPAKRLREGEHNEMPAGYTRSIRSPNGRTSPDGRPQDGQGTEEKSPGGVKKHTSTVARTSANSALPPARR